MSGLKVLGFSSGVLMDVELHRLIEFICGLGLKVFGNPQLRVGLEQKSCHFRSGKWFCFRSRMKPIEAEGGDDGRRETTTLERPKRPYMKISQGFCQRC